MEAIPDVFRLLLLEREEMFLRGIIKEIDLPLRKLLINSSLDSTVRVSIGNSGEVSLTGR